MLRRLTIGLVFGLIIGALLAFGLVRLGMPVFAGAGGAAVAYLAAAVTGAATGLVAGKPIWASGAKVEAGLKSLFGALLGAGAMLALQHWGSGFRPDVALLGGGGDVAIGDLPAASLPLIAAVLGALFGLDNTEDPPEMTGGPRKRVAAGGSGGGGARGGTGSRARVSGVSEGADDDDGESASPAAKRAKR